MILASQKGNLKQVLEDYDANVNAKVLLSLWPLRKGIVRLEQKAKVESLFSFLIS